MDIVYTSDDKFSAQIATSIASVMCNNKWSKMNFWVLSKGITEENKNKIQSFVEKNNNQISFIEIDNIYKYFGGEINTGSWNDIVLARLVLDKLLPETIERVIYLDGDTIVRDSLEELWNMDLSGKILGAVIEPTANKKRKKILGIAENGRYYNAGVLLIDLLSWKKQNARERIIKFYNDHGKRLFANDQDAINGELKNDIFSLQIKYNWCNTYQIYPYYAIKRMVKGYTDLDKEEYMREIKDPVIVHFLGEERPWRMGNKHKYKEDFIKYYYSTPFGENPALRDNIWENGWEKYFRAFYLFNRLMKPFPMLRLQIMNVLIPIFVTKRKKS